MESWGPGDFGADTIVPLREGPENLKSLHLRAHLCLNAINVRPRTRIRFAAWHFKSGRHLDRSSDRNCNFQDKVRMHRDSFLACLDLSRRCAKIRAGRLEEKQPTSKVIHGRRASLLTQKQDLKDLIATCAGWDTMIRDLLIIPNRKDMCRMFCTDLSSEVQRLRTELLKLQHTILELDLQENEVGVLEEVVRFVDEQLVEEPSFNGILVDRKVLARPRIRFWYRSRVKKHCLTFEDAARRFRAARGCVQRFRARLAMDSGCLDVRDQEILDRVLLGRGSTCRRRPTDLQGAPEELDGHGCCVKALRASCE